MIYLHLFLVNYFLFGTDDVRLKEKSLFLEENRLAFTAISVWAKMGTGELPIFSALVASQGCWPKGVCCHHGNLAQHLPGSQEEGPASLVRLTVACLFILFPHLKCPFSLLPMDHSGPRPNPSSPQSLLRNFQEQQ